MQRLLKVGTYFIVDTQSCGAYERVVFIWGPAFIGRNTVFQLVYTVKYLFEYLFLRGKVI